MSNKFETLTEIKKGQVGSGLLIESEGYIDLSVGDNRKRLTEAVSFDEDGKKRDIPYPFIVSAILQRADEKPNANNRIYPSAIIRREVDKFQVKIRNKMALLEVEHPESSNINLERVAAMILSTEWTGKDGNVLIGQIEILISDGYRNYGIISCPADQIAELILHGVRIGVSSRALGSVKQVGGVLEVQPDLELITFDVVSTPSVRTAYIGQTIEELEPFIECEKKDDSKLISESKFDKFDNWLL